MNSQKMKYINKKHYTFCISLLSQLIETIESEFKTSFNYNSKHKQLLSNITSLLKTPIQIFQDIIKIEEKQVNDNSHIQKIQNILNTGKDLINDFIQKILDIKTGEKNIYNETFYDTNTYNKKISGYLSKDEGRISTKDKFNLQNSDSIQSLTFTKKKNSNKNLNKAKDNKQINNKMKRNNITGDFSNKKKFIYQTENKKTEVYMSKAKMNTISNINKISVNQKNNPTSEKKYNTNTHKSDIILETKFEEENPVRKVKNIIINAKSVSSFNIGFYNQINNIDIKKRNFSKDRKCNEILIDGMKNIQMKLNSIGKDKKMKKAKSINDLNYIKIWLKNK